MFVRLSVLSGGPTRCLHGYTLRERLLSLDELPAGGTRTDGGLAAFVSQSATKRDAMAFRVALYIWILSQNN